MRFVNRQLSRLVLVLALGAGMAALASQPERPKVAVKEMPAPIIVAATLESAPLPLPSARVDQCSLNPRDYNDGQLIGDKSEKGAKKKKIVVCG